MWITVTAVASNRLPVMAEEMAERLADRGLSVVVGGRVEAEVSEADIVVLLGPGSVYGTFVHGVALGMSKLPIWCWRESISSYGHLNWVAEPEQVIAFVEAKMVELKRYLHQASEHWELRDPATRAPSQTGTELHLWLCRIMGVAKADPVFISGPPADTFWPTSAERLAKYDQHRGTFTPDLNLDHYSMTVNLLDLMAMSRSGFEWIHYYVASKPAREVARWRKEVSAMGGVRENDHEELEKVRSAITKAKAAEALGNPPDKPVVELEAAAAELIRSMKAAEAHQRLAVEKLAEAERALLPYDRTKIPVKVEG